MPEQPKKLFKYRSLDVNGYTEDLIRETKVFFGCPLDFNDLYDCRFRVSFEGSEEQKQRWCEELIRTRRPHLSDTEFRMQVGLLMRGFNSAGGHDSISSIDDFVQKRIRALGVFSMSEVNDDILMWSHYADSHRGICVEFETRNLGMPVYPIKYSGSRPVFDVFDPDHDSVGRRCVLTKSSHWEYEKEWRIVVNGSTVAALPSESLTGVVFGCRASDELKASIRAAIKDRYPQPALFQAREHPTEFRVLVEPLTIEPS